MRFGVPCSTVCWMSIPASVAIGSYLSKNLAVEKLAEQLLIGRTVFRNRTRHPRHIHVVLQRDILVRDVAAPYPTAHAGSHRHAVGESARIGSRLNLPNHD